MIKIYVMSRFQAMSLEYPLKEKTGIISIYSERQDPVDFPEDPNLIAVVPLQFDDVDSTGENPMQQFHAEMVHKFLDDHAKELDTLIVHCNFGACRSAAVAAAIMKAATGNDKAVFDTDGLIPNMHVYRLILNELLDEEGNSKLDPEIECRFMPREWSFD